MTAPATSTTTDQASSWEVPQGGNTPIVYVYDSFKYADKCGHALPLLRLVREVLCASAPTSAVTGRSRTSLAVAASTTTPACPICQTPIAFVTQENKKDEPTVLFKYNKQIYRLTVPAPTDGSADDVAGGALASPPGEHEQRQRPWWHMFLGVGDTSKRNDKRIRTATTTTAQGRVAQVLGMSVDGGKMKVRIV